MLLWPESIIGIVDIDIYKTAWGLVGPGGHYETLAAFADSAGEEGYRGIEFPVFYLDAEPGGRETAARAVQASLAEHDLDYIALIATRTDAWGDYDAHLASFREQCAQECKLIANDAGLRPCFETHRGRILYNPFVCATLLERIPDLELTSDLSHWLLVVDRIPNDIMDLFETASARSGHLHARIGHEKSPQVTEPADPAWEEHVALYRRWWKISVDAELAKGRVLSVSPEFGPPPYMHAEPFTGKPSADLVSANRWMRARLEDWFA